jgi:hypothetical protein
MNACLPGRGRAWGLGLRAFEMLDELERSNQIETKLKKKNPSRSVFCGLEGGGLEEGGAGGERSQVFRKQNSVNYKKKKSAGLVGGVLAGGREPLRVGGYESLFDGVQRLDSFGAPKVARDSRQVVQDSPPVFSHPAGWNPRVSSRQVCLRNSFGPETEIDGGQSRNPYQNLNNNVISYLSTSNTHLGQLTGPRKPPR